MYLNLYKSWNYTNKKFRHLKIYLGTIFHVKFHHTATIFLMFNVDTDKFRSTNFSTSAVHQPELEFSKHRLSQVNLYANTSSITSDFNDAHARIVHVNRPISFREGTCAIRQIQQHINGLLSVTTLRLNIHHSSSHSFPYFA